MKIQRPAARSLRSWLSACLCLGASCSVLCAPHEARADVSSWVFVGGGVARLQQDTLPPTAMGSMRLQIGLGSAPSNPLVFGGLLSLEPNFGHGSDLALLFRSASRGYVNGNFGLALDLGPYERFWGQGSSGAEATLWLGAPWGLSLGVGASSGSHNAAGLSAILGVDFARLTVHRNSGTNWFPNPFPAYRPAD